MQTEPIQIPIEAINEQFLSEAREVQSQMDKLDSTLKKAGVSQSTYNKVTQAHNEQLKRQKLSLTDVKSGLDMVVGGMRTAFNIGRDLYGSYQSYAGDVRDLSVATGQNARETSILIQTLDDYQISADDAQVAARALKEKGLSPTVETLAKLSDQFKAIKDPAKALEFAQDHLGRSYASFLNMLDQGGDAIQNTADGTNEWLIMTDEQIKKAEEARLAIDALSDSWQGAKVQMGSFVGGIIVESQKTEDLMEATKEYARENDIVIQNQRQARAIYEMLEERERVRNIQLERGAALTAAYNKVYGVQVNTMEAEVAAQEKREALAGQILTFGTQTTKMNEQIAASEEAIKQQFQGTAIVTTEYAVKLAELEKMKAEGRISNGWYQQSLEDLNKAHAKGELEGRVTDLKNSQYATELYRQEINGLNQDLAEHTITQQEYNESLHDLSAQFESGEYAARKQQEAMDALKQSTVDAFEEQAMAVLKAKEATNQQMLEFGVASGQISQEAANQQVAMDMLSDAFLSGKISASSYAQALGDVVANIGAIAGQDVKAKVEIEINILGNMEAAMALLSGYGGGGGAAAGAAAQQTGSGRPNRPNRPGSGAHASGGWLGGHWALVGDLPGGRPTATSELISPEGFVFDARTTRMLLASGALDDIVSHALPSEDYTSSGTSSPTTTTTQTRNRRRGGNRGGGGTAVGGLDFVSVNAASSEEAASGNNAVATQVAQQVQQAMSDYTSMAEGKFDEMIDVLKDANPRAVGKQVAYEVAKGL